LKIASDKQFKSLGYIIMPVENVGYRIFNESNSIDIGEKYKYPFCDIWIMDSKTNKYCYPVFSWARSLYSAEVYLNENIRNRKKILFSNFYLYCPNDAESYLSNYIG